MFVSGCELADPKTLAQKIEDEPEGLGLSVVLLSKLLAFGEVGRMILGQLIELPTHPFAWPLYIRFPRVDWFSTPTRNSQWTLTFSSFNEFRCGTE
jgi:hypothetical protein